MDQATYAVESEIEQTHWWFVVRRKLFRKTIEAMKLRSNAAILDIGTSTGSNLRMLREMAFTNFQGLDLNDDAIRWCAEKGLGAVKKGDICQLPFADAQFDLVLATDIVEHVEYDVQAMQEICRVLKPSGRAIITVPAFESLWGFQDTVSHHRRRYTRGELLDKLRASGCQAYQSYYFNFLLFVPIWTARQLIRIFKPKLESENQVNTPLINAVLKVIFSVDVACAGMLHVPFGVSIFALVGKDEA
jgi:ubiquinone/menaquinone biosynthesis C-methylase UbiE